MSRKIFRILPIIFYSVLIFYLSSLTSEEMPEEYFWNFYSILHFFEYMGFGLLCSFAFRKNLVFIPFLIGVLYAVSDEIHQYFVPTRYVSIADFIIDSLGVLTGVYLIYYFRRRIHA